MISTPCAKCSKCGCDCGKLPYTVTVTLSGLKNTHGVVPGSLDTFEEDYSCTMHSPRACFGSGVVARATAPGGCYGNLDHSKCDGINFDTGPITQVVVLDPGSCYAKYGRVEPQVFASCKPTVPREDGEPNEVVQLEVTLRRVERECSNALPQEEPSPGEEEPPVLPGQEIETTPMIPMWEVESISVSGGTGYKNRQAIQFTTAVGDTVEFDAIYTLLSDGNGIPYEARADINVEGTEVLPFLGVYYREDKSEPPYVAKVPLDFLGEPDLKGCFTPSGSGKDIEGIVDDDTSSPHFGKVIGTKINSGGDYYLTWYWDDYCLERLNDQPIVMRAASPQRLVRFEVQSCYGEGACIEAVPIGERTEPVLDFIPTIWPNTYPNFQGNLCGFEIEYTLSETTSADGGKAWLLDTVTASGGYGFAPYLGVQDKSRCCVFDEHPSVSLTRDKVGAVLSATVEEAGVFFREAQYDGQPSPVREIELVNNGSGYAKLGREEPNLKVYIKNGAGEPEVLSDFHPTLSEEVDDCGVDYWAVDGISLGAYTPSTSGESLFVEPDDTDEDSKKEKGAVARIVVERDENNEVTSRYTEVLSGGYYYRENKALDPYVTEYQTVVNQISPSDGEGAEVGIEIDDDPESLSFGKITKAFIVNGGSGYTLAGGPTGFKSPQGYVEACTYIGPCETRLQLNLRREPIEGEGENEEVGVESMVLTMLQHNGCDTTEDAIVVLDAASATNDCTKINGQLELRFGAFGYDDPSAVSAKIEYGGIWNPCLTEENENKPDCGYCPDMRDLCIEVTSVDMLGEPLTETSPCGVDLYGSSLACMKFALHEGGGTLGDFAPLSRIGEQHCDWPCSIGPRVVVPGATSDWLRYSSASVSFQHQKDAEPDEFGLFNYCFVHSATVGCDRGIFYLSATGGPGTKVCEPFSEENGSLLCTGWYGYATVECTNEEDWYDGITIKAELSYYDEFCNTVLPPPGFVTAKITKKPC